MSRAHDALALSVAVAALAGSSSPPPEQRLADLEQRVAELEACRQGGLPVQMARKPPYPVVGVEDERRARFWLALTPRGCLE